MDALARRTLRSRWRTVTRHPSAVLLVAQLGVVLLYPFLDHELGRAVIGLAQMGVVLIAVWAVRRTPCLLYTSDAADE